MNGKETLSALLAADREASKLQDDAARIALEQESRIKEKKDALRREYDARAAAAIAEANRVEREKAEAELARLDQETDLRLAEVRARFEAGKERYADRLFAIVTGASDGQ